MRCRTDVLVGEVAFSRSLNERKIAVALVQGLISNGKSAWRLEYRCTQQNAFVRSYRQSLGKNLVPQTNMQRLRC
jgi:predicted enzyme involved in methoxymalonyl-ACP biosynthesis